MGNVNAFNIENAQEFSKTWAFLQWNCRILPIYQVLARKIKKKRAKLGMKESKMLDFAHSSAGGPG